MEQKDLVTVVEDTDVVSVNYDNNTLKQLAATAEKRLANINKIMGVALRITNGIDWVIIGGKAYLQESGATKVASLFGISWSVLSVEHRIDEGYPAVTYRMRFSMAGKTVEAMGSRSGKDEFFAGKDRKNSPDAIDAGDVEKAAYTNCLNRGIKAILPGLKNIDVETLEQQGIKVKNGYTFKSGSKGGQTEEQKNAGIVCACCGKEITQKIASFSESRFGKRLCMDCQKKQNVAKPDDGYDDGYIPPEPPAR